MASTSARRAAAPGRAGCCARQPATLASPASIATLCAHIDAPVNIGARPGLPGIAELGRLGVARVSTATRLATLALCAARDAALRLRSSGRFEGLDAAFGYPDLQRLFTPHS